MKPVYNVIGLQFIKREVYQVLFLKTKPMLLKVSRRTFSIFALALLVFAVAGTALADSPNYYVPLVKIPGMPTGDVSLTTYLSTLFNFLISIVGIPGYGSDYLRGIEIYDFGRESGSG